MRTIFILSLLVLITECQASSPIQGAWQLENGGETSIWIFSGKFYSISTYSVATKAFNSTRGGSWSQENDFLLLTEEFNTKSIDHLGKIQKHKIKFQPGIFNLETGESATQWKQLDAGAPGLLAGAWLITSRVTGGQQNPITPGARKTLKILSGTRFQWIAYNSETGEFFGTGGGTYTTVGNKYTETIEFLSRDSTRVGMNLGFNFELKTDIWHHMGFSSKGDAIDEVWTRREVLGL